MSLLHHTHITRPRQKEAHCTHRSCKTYKVGRNVLQANYFVAMLAFNQPAAYAQQHATLNRTYQGSLKHGVQYDLGATGDASAVHLRFQSWGISCISHFGYEANKSKSGEEGLASTSATSFHLEQIKVASKRQEAQAEKKKRSRKKTIAKESAILKYKEEIDSGHSPETVEVTFTAQDKERIKAFEEAYMQRFRKKPPRNMPYFIKMITQRPPATVARNLDELIASFGLKSAESVMRRQSRLLFHNKEVLKERFHDACKLYGWSAEEGVRALRKDSIMIASTIERQKESRQELMELLGVSGDVVSRMVLRFPNILNTLSSPKTIASKVSILERQLQLPAEDICRMFVKQPSLIQYREEVLIMRVAFFVQLWYTIHDFINRSGMGTATLVRATPLAGEPAAALEPGMISPREVGMMLKAQPGLLTVTALNLNYKLAVVMACCQKDSQWMKAISKISVKTLATYLTYGAKRFGRLKYWQSIQPAQELSLAALLWEKDEEFDIRCPGFQMWYLDEEIKMLKAKNI